MSGPRKLRTRDGRSKHRHSPGYGEFIRCRICGQMIYKVAADENRAEYWRAVPKLRA